MKHKRHKRPVEKLRALLINAAILSATTLVLLELALRVFGFTNPVLYEADSNAGYRLKPDQHVEYLGNTIDINRWGLRDARPLDGKTEGKRRILVLGDSVTWGGIREKGENLFTVVLENRLMNAEVLNAGVNGYSVCQMVALFQTHLEGLEPELVLVYAIPDDFARPEVSRLTGHSVAFPQRRPRLALPVALKTARALAHLRFGFDWLQGPPAAEAVGEALPEPERIARNVAAVQALSRRLPGKVRLVIGPTRGDTVKDKVLAALRDAGVAHVDLCERMDAKPGFFVDRVHLSTEGHAQVGEELFRLLNDPVDG